MDARNSTIGVEPRRPEVWEKAFLASLAVSGNVSTAAKKAKIERTTPYHHREKYPDFKVSWEEALKKAADVLEAEAFRRAVKGVKKPVFQGGRQVGFVREFSDPLLQFLMKGVNPEKYRERIDHKHTGRMRVSKTDEEALDNLTDEELCAIDAIYKAAASRSGGSETGEPAPEILSEGSVVDHRTDDAAGVDVVS